MTVKLGGIGQTKFAFDKTESAFANFSEESFRTIPRLLAASTDWLRVAVPGFKVASHQFLYSTHSQFKELPVQEFLRTMNPRTLSAGGQSLGSGAIFNFRREDTGWLVQLLIDRSQSIKDGLFVSFGVTVIRDIIDFDEFFITGRTYLESMLSELNLRLSVPAER
jgi:hypothetical protein